MGQYLYVLHELARTAWKWIFRRWHQHPRSFGWHGNGRPFPECNEAERNGGYHGPQCSGDLGKQVIHHTWWFQLWQNESALRSCWNTLRIKKYQGFIILSHYRSMSCMKKCVDPNNMAFRIAVKRSGNTLERCICAINLRALPFLSRHSRHPLSDFPAQICGQTMHCLLSCWGDWRNVWGVLFRRVSSHPNRVTVSLYRPGEDTCTHFELFE